MNQPPGISSLLADLGHLNHLREDVASGAVPGGEAEVASISAAIALVQEALDAATGGPPIFTWNDVVRVADCAPPSLRPGEYATVVGISRQYERRGDYLKQFPAGNVYTVEFDDGSSEEVEQGLLQRD